MTEPARSACVAITARCDRVILHSDPMSKQRYVSALRRARRHGMCIAKGRATALCVPRVAIASFQEKDQLCGHLYQAA